MIEPSGLRKPLVWIDICNSPHVLFFKPIIEELRKHDVDVYLTAQDFGQTLSLLRLWGIPFISVGGSTGKSVASKVVSTLGRVWGLMGAVRPHRPRLLVSHGSRSAVIAASILGVPSVTLDDYEHSFTSVNNRLSKLLLFPSPISDEVLASCGIPLSKVKHYPGFKEEVYLAGFQPDRVIDFGALGIPKKHIVVLLRPPATTAHYHRSETTQLFEAVVEFLDRREGVSTIVLGRNEAQRSEMTSLLQEKKGFVVPRKAFDGLNLLWSVDIMIGGGGTMNREAALLGIPTYSFFTSDKPAVDIALVQQGKLQYLSSDLDVARIELVKRTRSNKADVSRAGLDFIVNEIRGMVTGT